MLGIAKAGLVAVPIRAVSSRCRRRARIEIVDAFPETVGAKILKYRLRERLAARVVDR